MERKFDEVVFEGHYSSVRGYLEGFLAGSGTDFEFFFCSDSQIDSETFAELLKEWISLGNKIHHVVMEEGLYARLEKGLARCADRGLLGQACVKSVKRVKEASFSFTFVTYGRTYAKEIRDILERLPAGLSLSGYNPVEKVEKDAKGESLYAPVHDYSFSGEGKVAGPVDAVVAFRKELDDHPLIDAGRVKLVF